MTYRAGDHWVLCDRCGFKKRHSRTAKEWTGLVVCLDGCFEERHPQDFVRGRMDHQRVIDPRPEPVDNILGPLTTTVTVAAVGGATSLTIESTVRFDTLDNVGIMLANGNLHRAVVNGVSSSTVFTLTAATKLPDRVAVGALVINYSAVAEADIG